MPEVPVASFTGEESNAKTVNEPIVDPDALSFGFLGQIPRNFSLSHLTADFNISSGSLSVIFNGWNRSMQKWLYGEVTNWARNCARKLWFSPTGSRKRYSLCNKYWQSTRMSMVSVFLALCLLVCSWIPRVWIPVMLSRVWLPFSGLKHWIQNCKEVVLLIKLCNGLMLRILFLLWASKYDTVQSWWHQPVLLFWTNGNSRFFCKYRGISVIVQLYKAKKYCFTNVCNAVRVLEWMLKTKSWVDEHLGLWSGSVIISIWALSSMFNLRINFASELTWHPRLWSGFVVQHQLRVRCQGPGLSVSFNVYFGYPGFVCQLPGLFGDYSGIQALLCSCSSIISWI
ncbi:putative angiotensin-converting enzyme 2 [Helianthus annuus]|nr:putative angiotensin-converting enzyme 2 [Helianthus annuus]